MSGSKELGQFSSAGSASLFDTPLIKNSGFAAGCSKEDFVLQLKGVSLLPLLFGKSGKNTSMSGGAVTRLCGMKKSFFLQCKICKKKEKAPGKFQNGKHWVCPVCRGDVCEARKSGIVKCKCCESPIYASTRNKNVSLTLCAKCVGDKTSYPAVSLYPSVVSRTAKSSNKSTV